MYLAALCKSHTGALRKAIKCIDSDACDICTDFNSGYRSLVLRPRCNSAGSVAAHSTRSFNSEQTIPKEYPFQVRSRVTSRHYLRIGAAGIKAVLEHASFTADIHISRDSQSIFVEIINIRTSNFHIAGYRCSASQVHQPIRLCISGKAGIQFIFCTGMIVAFFAGQLTRLAVIDIRMLIVSALSLFLGICVKYCGATIGIHVVCRHRNRVTVGGNGHIDAVKVHRGFLKVERRIIHHTVALAAGGTADVVDNTVLLIHISASQRSGSGIAVIVAGKEEVNSRRFNGLRQDLLVFLAAAGGIGVVNGHMGGQDLPRAVTPRGILHQPTLELLQLVLVHGVVQNRHIHVAVFHGIPVRRQIEDVLCRHGAVTVVIRLMVADHMDHVILSDPVQREQVQRVLPLIVVTHIVHGVAGLEAKVEVRASEAVDNVSHAGQGILFLNVRHDEEIRLAVICFRSDKGPDIGPDAAIAHLIIVGGIGSQSGEKYTVDPVGHRAAAVGDDAAFALHSLAVGHIRAGVQTDLGSLTGIQGIAHPGDVLLRGGILRHVMDDIIGLAGLIAGSGVAGHRNGIRAVAAGVHGIYRVGTRLLSQDTGGNTAGFIRGAQLLPIAVVDIHAHGGIAVLVGNRQHGRQSHHHRTGGHAVLRGAAVGFRGSAEAFPVIVRAFRGIGSLCHLHIDSCAFRGGSGNIHQNGCQKFSGGRGRNIGDLNINLALFRVEGISTGHALSELHVRHLVAPAQCDRGIQSGEISDGIGRQIQLPGLAYRGSLRHLQGHVGQAATGIHREAAGLAGHIAEAVLQIEGHGMLSVGHSDSRQGAAQVVLAALAIVNAVQIEVGGVNAGGKLVSILGIMIGDEEIQGIAVQNSAVFQIASCAVIIDELDV